MDARHTSARITIAGACFVASLCALMVAATDRPAPPVNEMVRRDWYFRETLPAIADWETILARWETATPDAKRTPVLPVPRTGQSVVWPNPIPLTLLPETDPPGRVTVRPVGDGFEVERDGTGAEGTKRPGDTVAGYKHPGGGAKDGWYHQYERRFDRLTTFQPEAAPFALALDAPFDFRPGANELPVSVAHASDAPVDVTLRLRLMTVDQDRGLGERSVHLTANATEVVRLPFTLASQGGGILILTLEAQGRTYWLPLFTHVENVSAVLTSIDQILADTPDAVGAKRAEALRYRVDAGPSAGAWRPLFEEASALRDELLLRRIHFDSLLFVKRKPYISEQPYMDAHHLFNRPGGGIYRLSPVRPSGKVTSVVDSLGEGVYRDVCLHWDASRILFSFGNGNDAWDGKQSYHLYEARADGSGMRQITTGPKNDCEPFYLPNGQIGFTSDRAEHFVMCGGDRHSANLFVMEGDGSSPRQLSFNVFNDFNPTVMPDGRILYSRWEYNERSVTSLHKLFTMNPDGTHVAPFYGNATIRPNVTMFPRVVPGTNKVMTLFTAHHGQTHGPIGVIDVGRGVDGPAPITVLTPGVPVTGEKAEDSRVGWFSDPMPLSETTYLCSFTPTVQPWLERSWALYIGDRHGNLALVYRDPDISCAEPIPLVRRPSPLLRSAAPAESAATGSEARLMMVDVYQGLSGVKRGDARYLRILEDMPRKGVHTGGVVVTAATDIYTVKRILGVVPIRSDGSADFAVPANRNVYFEVLDARQREIQRMRSVVCLKPGEKRTCVGCHERRQTAPPNSRLSATAGLSDRIAPMPWGDKTFSFLRDVQPIINARCTPCHTYDRAANGVVLTDDLTDRFSVAYEELTPFISRANAMRWDHPDDVYARPVYTYGSAVSRLTKMLEAGHHGVRLTEDERTRLMAWIDANGVYYDRYESTYGDRRIFSDAVRNRLKPIYARRCGGCHGQSGDGRVDTWWLSVNRRDAQLSRALMAPLARSAGGWQRCDEVVFASREDPDYRIMADILTSVREMLVRRPREDLLSIRGTDAERQTVAVPPPPPSRAREGEAPPSRGTYLSDMPWESAGAGWSPNGDGQPRRDSDIEENRLRAGTRTYRKGIGTHAPSEIVVRLDGKFDRFRSVVGGGQSGGTVVFRVYADAKLVLDTGAMTGLERAKSIDVSVAGAQRLRLVVTDAGDGINADVANWADAVLLRAEGTKGP